MRRPVDVVKEAKNVLSDPNHWIKGHLALDSKGNNVLSDDPNACQFCLMGGFFRAAYNLQTSFLDRPYQRAFLTVCKYLEKNEHTNMMNYNDAESTTHEALMSMLDANIVELDKIK